MRRRVEEKRVREEELAIGSGSSSEEDKDLVTLSSKGGGRNGNPFST